jgi:hypothetical protein
MLHLAEVALERAAREPCGLDHDIEQGGMEHDPWSCLFLGKARWSFAYTPGGSEATLSPRDLS